MRVRFINRLSGGVMYVDESRVEEYKAAGHRPAADVQPAAEIPKKTTRAKKTTKK